MKQDALRTLIRDMPGVLFCDWVALPSLGVEVTAQPLRLYDRDGPIFPASRRTADACAIALGAQLTTPEIEDAIWKFASVRLEPITMQHSADIWSDGMIWWSRVEHALSTLSHGTTALISVADKSWVRATAPPGMAANYGFHIAESSLDRAGKWRGIRTFSTFTPCGAVVLQPLACAHNFDHADYSQHVRLVRNV